MGGVRTYYWDRETSRWVALAKLGIDGERGTLRSEAHHFTTMINAVLSTPESPAPLQFNPNTIKDIAAVEPTQEMDLIQMPQANNRGTANLRYPLRLPAGRGSHTPEIELVYDSSHTNGWLGAGWNLIVSDVQVDTRWGVPAYDGSERYLLEGEAVVPIPPTPGVSCAAPGTTATEQYAPRVDAFARILKCTTANGVHWEATNTDGTRFEYGTDAASRLTSYHSGETDHVALWYLRRVVDPNGNVTEYAYVTDAESGGSDEPFVQSYLRAITYTSHLTESLAPAYRVLLNSDCATRSDLIVSGRYGFKTTTRCRLTEVQVDLLDGGTPTPIRSYTLNYTTGAFEKSLLSGVTAHGADGATFYEHTFDYTDPQETVPFTAGATTDWPVVPGNVGPLDNGDRLVDATLSEGHGTSFGVGAEIAVGAGGAEVGCSVSAEGEAMFTGANPAIRTLDVNGDRIADRIWVQGNTLRVVLGESQQPGGQFDGPAAGGLYGLTNLPFLGSQGSRGGSIGINGGCSVGPASVSAGLSFSVRRADTFSLLSDADGDGLLDLTDGTSLYRGLPHTCRDGSDPGSDGTCPDGLPACPDAGTLCFAPASAIAGAASALLTAATPQAITATEAVSWSHYTAAPMRMQDFPDLAAEMYKLDPVIRWDARHTGQISFTVRARRRYLGGADGVSVTLAYVTDPTVTAGTQLLGELVLGPNESGWATVPGSGLRDVNFGESLVVVVDTVDQVPVSSAGDLMDEIDLEIHLEYRRVCPLGQPCRDLAPGELDHRDATGQLAYVFNFPDDMRTSELPKLSYWTLLPPLGPPREHDDGSGVDRNIITGTVTKLAETDTPVHVRVRCESANTRHARDGSICSMGALWAYTIFTPTETGSVPLTVTLPSPFRETHRVAGSFTTGAGHTHAFFWSPESPRGAPDFVDLGTMGGLLSEAHDANDAGQVVGGADTLDGDQHAFLWTAERGMRDLGTLGGKSSVAHAINADGLVVGESDDLAGATRAFLWSEGRGMIDLGTLGGMQSRAFGINDAGQVVGSSTTAGGELHAFLWADANANGQSDPGEMQDLGTLSIGGSPADSVAVDVNEAGQVAGFLEGPQIHPFFWSDANANGQPDPGEMQDLGTLGGDFAEATALDDTGRVVGWSNDANGEPHAFVWTAEQGMVDLGLGRALDVNAFGQVVGEGLTAGSNFIWTEAAGRSDLGLPSAVPLAINDPLAFEPIRLMFEVDGENGAEVPPDAIEWNPTLRIVSLYDVSDVQWPAPEASQLAGWGDDTQAATWVDVKRDGAWTVGETWNLGTLDAGASSQARAINNAGRIVGGSEYTVTATPPEHAFLWAPVDRKIWDDEERMLDFHVPFTDTHESWMNDVNASGQMVGTFTRGLTAVFPHGFMVTPGGSLLDFGALTDTLAINNRGEVVGERGVTLSDHHAFMWSDENDDGQIDAGEIRDLGTLGGANSSANDVNDNGAVVGWSEDALGDRRAFLWTQRGGMIDLGTLGGAESEAYAINNRGQVVGTSRDGDGISHPFLWTEEHGMVDLYPAAVSNSSNVAYDVNERGQVVGQSWDPDRSKGFIWEDANDDGQPDAGEFRLVDPALRVRTINNGTVGDFAKQGDTVFLDPEQNWIESPRPLFRVHPARQLRPFRTFADNQILEVAATIVDYNYYQPLTVNVLGDDYEGPLGAETVGMLDVLPGNRATTKRFTTTLPTAGLYYVRGYAHATYDPFTSMTLTAKLVGLETLALVHEVQGRGIVTYTDVNTSSVQIAVVEDSPWEFLARAYFPQAPVILVPSLEAAVDQLLIGEATVVLGAPDALRALIQEPDIADTAFLCCTPGNPQPLSFDVPVRTNLLTAEWGTGWRSRITMTQALEELPGEVHYAFEPYAGGHHGFFYGQFNGSEALTCLGPDPCTDAPLALAEAAAPQAITLPPTCALDSDDDGLPDCIDPQPYACTGDLEVNPDVNDDGQLNVLDIAQIAAALGTTADDPGWDPRLDLNNNGEIDPGDVRLAAERWRQDPQAIDRDGDGIPDCADDDVGQPEDYDGNDDGDGAPDPGNNDGDGDGVPDLQDRCPLSPEDVDGDLDGDGCPDRDRGSQNGTEDDPDGSRDLGPGGDPGERVRRFEPMNSGGGGDGRQCFIGSDPSARVCDDGGTHPSRGGGTGGAGDGDGDGVPPGDGVKRSWTMGANTFIAAGVGLDDLGIPLSLKGSFMTGVSLVYGDRDYLDWNGDGVPDRHSPNVVTLAGLDEDVELGIKCLLEIANTCLIRPAIHSNYNATMGFALSGGAGGSFDIKTDSDGVVIGQGWSNLNFGLNAHASQSRTINDRFDVNGDGLPDVVYTDSGGRLIVRLNLGYRLGQPEDWGSLNLPAGNNPGTLASQLSITDKLLDLGVPNHLYRSDNLATSIDAGVSAGAKVLIFGGSFTGGRSESATLVQMPHHFADLNGDGLTDLVMKNAQEQTIYVRYNRGAGLDATVVTYSGIPTWDESPRPPEANTGLFGEALDWINDVRTETPDALHVSGSTSERIEGTIEELVLGVKSTQSYKHVEGQQLLELALRDVNGDGLPDRVLRSGREGGATIQVQENRLAGANLLRTVHRPLGGRIDLAYEQRQPTTDDPNARWVLSSAVLRNDTAFPSAHSTTSITQTITYTHPYYDRFEREFLGFEQVTTTYPDGRVNETDYANRDYRLQGQVLRMRVVDTGGNLFRETVNAYAPTRTIISTSERQQCLSDLRLPLAYLANSTLDAAGRTPCDVWFTNPVSTTTAHYEGSNTPQEQIRVYAYDAYGNITQLHDHQDSGDPGDDLFATITYSHTPRFIDAHIVDRAHTIDVRQGSTSGARLRFRRGSYDAHGNLTDHEAFNDSAGNQIATLDLAYDAAGFVTTITDTAGYVLTYTPDSLVHTLNVEIEDGFGLTSTKDYDFRFQKPTVFTDVNGQVRANHYDTFGRITAIQGPYELAAGRESLTIDYSHVSSLPAYVVSTNQSVRPGESALLTSLRTAIFVDGMGRVIQRQDDTEVDGQVGRQVSGKVEFDGAGRRIREGLNVFRTGTTIQFEALSLTPNRLTAWEYDVLNRPTRVTRPGNRVTRQAYTLATAPEQPAIRTLQVEVTDPNGEVRLQHYDAADNLVALVERLEGRDLTTHYAYRPTGELLTITDALSRTTAIEYDLAGRRTAVTTPDTGRLELGYDANGNLIEETDQVLCPHSSDLLDQCGSNEKIRYQYDRNRLIFTDYPKTPDVTYTYGDADSAGNCAGLTNVQGQICQVADGGGVERRGYGALGEVTLRARAVPGAPGGMVTRTFTTTFLYDSFGRMLEMTYPDGEDLSYTYDGGGRVTRVAGTYGVTTTTYVHEILYNEFGQQTQMVHGANAVTTTYQYEPDTLRLDVERIASQASPVLLRETDYTYDPVGNILAVQDARPTADPFLDAVTRNYSYDDLHRLTAMSMIATGSPTTTTYVTNTLAYDDVGNIVTQTVGRRENATPLPGYPSRDWSYAYGNSAHPNLPDTIGPYSFTYDARGSILTSSRSGGSSVPAGATYTWDDAGRLASSQRQGGTEVTGYTYTSTGDRIRKQTPMTVTGTITDYDVNVYPNPYYTARFAQEPTTGCAHAPCWEEIVSRSKHVYVNGRRVAVKALVVDPASTGNAEGQLAYLEEVQHFFHTDPVESTTLLTNESGERVQEIDYLPFGEVLFDRQAAGSSELPQAYRFDGKELDPETGLQYFGARYYDPRLGRWISADPLYRTRPEIGLRQPDALNLYVFGRNNPVSYHDPNGQQSTLFTADWKMKSQGKLWLNRISALNRQAEVSFNQGHYGTATVAIILSTAGYATAAMGAAYDVVIGTPWNAGMTLGQGLMEDDPKKIAVGAAKIGLIWVGGIISKQGAQVAQWMDDPLASGMSPMLENFLTEVGIELTGQLTEVKAQEIGLSEKEAAVFGEGAKFFMGRASSVGDLIDANKNNEAARAGMIILVQTADGIHAFVKQSTLEKEVQERSNQNTSTSQSSPAQDVPQKCSADAQCGGD